MEDGKALNRRSSQSEFDGGSKRARVDESALENSDMEAGDSAGGAGAELTMGDHFFKPFYLISPWIEPNTTTRRLLLASNLPSCVGPGGWSSHVAEGGEYYELQVPWPVELIDVKLLHRKWLNADGEGHLEPYHPKILAIAPFLKELRPRIAETVKSTAKIPLPIMVQTTDVGRSRLQPRGSSTRLLYVDFRAAVEHYALTEDHDGFESL